MDFMMVLRSNFEKLQNFNVITKIWKEIITGKKCEVTAEELIEYSFHYPVDTDVYLEELIQKYDLAMKEEFRTIEGNLKAYLQTFLYYCMATGDRIPIKTSLYAAQLYLKIILLPSDIGKLYFEKNIYIATLQIYTLSSKNRNLPESLSMSVLELIFKYSFENEINIVLLQGTANMFSNIVKIRGDENTGDIKICTNKLAQYSLKCLIQLISINDHPRRVKCIIQSILRCLRKNPCENISPVQRRISINISKSFIKNVMFTEIEKNKLQYFLDALFGIWGMSDFDLIEDSVEIINMLDEQSYKELLRRIPNYLESKNHKHFYANLMIIIYQMLVNLHPGNFEKLDVLFTVCLRDIIIHFLNKNRHIQDKAVDVLAKIFSLQDNVMVNGIFELSNLTGKFATLKTDTILKAMIKILDDKYAGNPVRNKNMLIILSRFLISLNVVDGDLSSQILYLICKDGTPYSLKSILPNLHELYLQLSTKSEKVVRRAILRILFKHAMHQDASSSVFLEHLYNSIVYSSNVNGHRYGPESYSNILLSDEFEYSLLFTKCRHLIRYDNVYHTIANLNFREPGHCVLLNSLLEFVNYKEYNILTDYIVDNYSEICVVENAGILLNAYNRILKNKGVYHQTDLPKFDIIHGLLWNSLFKQLCVICNIKSTFDLIDTLKAILHLDDDDRQRVNLLTITTERAYRALTLNQFHQGSVMHLTELSVVLKKAPRPEILVIFENIMENPETMTLLKTHCKDTLIQLVAFFGTIAMMNKSKVPIAAKLLKMALDVDDAIVKLSAIKMYYAICTEITHEFEEVINFCFQNVTSSSPSLSRICVLILEELIHENYVLLNSEYFLKFIYRLGSMNLHAFMKHTLETRFMLSNKHDIGRFYMTTIIYLSGYTKFENFPVSSLFYDDLKQMRSLVDCPNDLIKYLFNSIQLNTRFNILGEMCLIFDTLIAGKCKVDEHFFTYLSYSLYTFKVMAGKKEFDYNKNYYSQVCKSIEKQIFNKDPKFRESGIYGEYEIDIKQCTLSLLQLLAFVQYEEQMSEVRFSVFDTAICWIDHVKPELIHYVHYEKGKDFDHPLRRIVNYYKSNKERLENVVNNQERL